VILELVGSERARYLTGEPVCHAVVALGRVRGHVRAGYYHLRPVGLEEVDLVLAHLVRHHENGLVALDGGNERQANTRVARRRLDDGASRLELAFLFGSVDHGDAYTVFDASAGVEVLDLHVNLR
jgi:hypothetical protein